MKIPFFKNKIKTIAVKLLAPSPGKFICVIWNLVTKTYSKFITLRSFWTFLNFVKKIEIIYMNSEKSINSFKINRIGYLIICRTIFSINLSITFRHYYHAKYMFLTSLIRLILSIFCYGSQY